MDSKSTADIAPPWQDLYARYCAVMDELAQRLERIVTALRQHEVPYALRGRTGGHLVGFDRRSARYAHDERHRHFAPREDLPKAKAAAATVGLDFAVVMGVSMFIEKLNPQPSSGVHILWANEIVRPGDPLPAPAMEDATILENNKSVVSLQALVIMKLTAWRRHDQVHLDDLLKVGLIDASWCARLPALLAARLQHLIDTPEG